MRLEPVYLLQPDEERSKQSRRAVLFGVIGAAIGAGTGWIVHGVLRGPREAPTPGPILDERLRWALELLDGPVEDLVEFHIPLLFVLWEWHEQFPELWDGVQRIGVSLIERDDLVTPENRKTIAATLIQTIEAYAHPPSVGRLLPALRRLAR